VLYAVMSTATERPPRAKRDTGEEARFFRKLRRVADNREAEASGRDPSVNP